MAYPVTGSPLTALVDGVRTVLLADATLMALITGLYGHVSEAARVAYPYLVIGRRTRDGLGGAMGVAGGTVTVEIEGWSDAKGPYAMQAILSRVAVLLERQPVTVTGYSLVTGSVHCEHEDVFDEPDEDKPGSRLYHGLQRWTAEIHES